MHCGVILLVATREAAGLSGWHWSIPQPLISWLAPRGAKTPVDMILIVLNKQLIVYHEEGFQDTVPSWCPEVKIHTRFMFPQNNSQRNGLTRLNCAILQNRNVSMKNILQGTYPPYIHHHLEGLSGNLHSTSQELITRYAISYVDGSVQERRNSIANALSYNNPSMCRCGLSSSCFIPITQHYLTEVALQPSHDCTCASGTTQHTVKSLIKFAPNLKLKCFLKCLFLQLSLPNPLKHS